LFTNRVLASGDILLYFYPYRDYAAAALRAGQIPLWNPYIFTGAPFLANPQAAVLYPLHWPLSWLPVTKQIYWSAALHSWILGYGGYLLVRRSGGGQWPGLVTALILAGSGFYGGLIGHINQMNGAAWLPWALWAVADHQTGGATARNMLLPRGGPSPRWARAIALFALFVTLMVLAGHTQTAYINLFGVGLWLAWSALAQLPSYRMTVANGRRLLALLLPGLAIYGAGVALAMLLSAAQLLPTLELSSLGLRSGGLTYNEVSSFSLRPLRLPWTVLPTYGLLDLGPIFGVGYTEFVAYVGIVGLLLALWGAWRGRGPLRTMGLFFVATGLFLALGRWNPVYYLLYKVVPGFDLFRVPARWLMLYTLGMALLAAVGTARLMATLKAQTSSHRRQLAKNILLGGLLCLLLVADLMLAAQSLPHTHPTAPQAVYGVRTAPAHLLTDPVRSSLAPAAMGRFLGMSTITYDPGDMGDWRKVLLAQEPPQLDRSAFDQLIIALKIQELLVPNLPLFWRIPAVDGFDGGVLPLQRYNQFMPLFVPRDELVPDGRLREQIREVPPAQLLGLLNVQYLITDKVRDLWFEGVYYDRQIGARLDATQPVVTIDVPTPFAATHLDLIGYLDGESVSPDGNDTVATITVQSAAAPPLHLTLTDDKAGANFADPQLDSALAQQRGAVAAFRDVEQGQQEYRARLPFPQPVTPTTITIAQTNSAGLPVIQAATLYDERTGMFIPLLPSDRGRFRLVHSGDVKIYENLDLRPRAYLVHKLFAAADTDGALTQIRVEAAIRQGKAAVVEPLLGTTKRIAQLDQESRVAPSDQVRLLDYSAEAVTLMVSTTEDAFLVLSDAYFPGWRALVDGVETPIYPTNVLFRGIEVPAGEHQVIFRYQPQSWRSGLWL
ncbi:MAG: YfhO family protein, partial [Caldilineaceae bacterium]|nr:YfhO family protein [Caldilineaceae bacterium]